MDMTPNPTERRKLIGLSSQRYEHPYDRNALASLRGTFGLELLIRKFNEYGLDRLLKIQFTGSNLRINGDNFPEIHDLVREACEILDLHLVPDIYVQDEIGINAFTAGVDRPILVLNASCIDHLSADELFFVVGHELGHIKSEHILYHQVGKMLPVIGELVSSLTLGLGDVVATALELALLNWQRMSEFTADRAGLLVCQKVNVSISAMVKIAGLPHKFYDRFNVDDFIAQAKEFKGYDVSALDKIAKVVSIMGETHPWTVLRAAEFMSWTEAGAYERVMETCGKPQFCIECGNALSDDDVFCTKCGHRLLSSPHTF